MFFVRMILKSYFCRRPSRFHVAAEEHLAVYPHTYNPKYRGTTGPIHTSTPHHFHTLDLLFQQSFVNKGCNAVVDPYGGDVSDGIYYRRFVIYLSILKIDGTWMASATMDPATWTRSYAATGYYEPNKDRPNLTVCDHWFREFSWHSFDIWRKVLTEAVVSRILFDDGDGKDITATGLEFIHDGKTYKVMAKKEVILSAG